MAGGALCTVASAQGVSLSRTRVVFSATDKVKTLSVRNSSGQRYLIQARSVAHADDRLTGPFMLTPPLFLLAAGQQQILKIIPAKSDWPGEKESVSYLTVSAIPTQNEEHWPADASKLSLGFRFTIKIFYRPAHMAQTFEQAAASLQFSRKDHGLLVINPGGYFMTVARLRPQGSSTSVLSKPIMIPPGGRAFIPANKKITKVSWRVINDYGVLSQYYHNEGF
nr:molecular chaperone [Izhakiella australiensis]